jgi:predicted transcriptional regulator
MWLELLKNCIYDEFGEKLRETLNGMGLTIKEFSAEASIPTSTLYKIISDEKKDFRRSTLKQIVEGVRRLEGTDQEDVIGIITTRNALDTIGRVVEIDGKVVHVKEFPATTIEEEIIQGVRAEKEGVKGIICGPIAATTLEKVVDVPITALRFEEGPLLTAITKLTEKL